MTGKSYSVESHYTASDLGERVLAALASMGKDLNALTPQDLAPIDALHLRGRDATRELAQIVGLTSGANILDVGSGMGGSARYLAHEYGCSVTGLDLTEDLCNVATMLSERLNLAQHTRFRHGSALDMPFEDDSFDLVWTEHAQMNIRDKTQLYSEIARVLRPGGKLAFHDIFQGSKQEAHFPLPWANDSSISFLAPPAEIRHYLESLGLIQEHWQDATSVSLSWTLGSIERMKTHGLPPLSQQLILGEDIGVKLQNLVSNLEDDRLAVIQAVFLKPA